MGLLVSPGGVLTLDGLLGGVAPESCRERCCGGGGPIHANACCGIGSPCGPALRPGPLPGQRSLRLRMIITEGFVRYEIRGHPLFAGLSEADLGGIGVEADLVFEDPGGARCWADARRQVDVPLVGTNPIPGVPTLTITFDCLAAFLPEGFISNFLGPPEQYHFYGGATPIPSPGVEFNVGHMLSSLEAAWCFLPQRGAAVGANARLPIVGEPQNTQINGSVEPIEAIRSNAGCPTAWRAGCATNIFSDFGGGVDASSVCGMRVECDLREIGPCP